MVAGAPATILARRLDVPDPPRSYLLTYGSRNPKTLHMDMNDGMKARTEHVRQVARGRWQVAGGSLVGSSYHSLNPHPFRGMG